MSKYAKFTDDILRKKLKGSINDDLFDLNVEATSLLETFDRVKVEELLDRYEVRNKELKELKKKMEEEQKRLEEEERRLEEEERKREKEEEIKRKKPLVIPGVFTDMKSSFGIMKEDENGEPLYPSLFDQSKSEVVTHNYKLYKAKYREDITFDRNKEYIHKNLNSGFVNVFEEFKDYIYVCFRLAVNPLDGKCLYSSWWIVNSELEIQDLIKEDSGLFEFTKVEECNVDSFLIEFRKNESSEIIDEKYTK